MATPAFSLKRSLGLTVRLERIRRRWRQADLAAAAQVSQADVSALERDRYVIPSRRGRILATLGIEREAAHDAR